MTTVHANSSRDSLSRIEQMIGMSGIDMPQRAARAQISSAVNVVIQVSRLSDGRRKVTSLSEITGMEGETITMQEIFRFKQTRSEEHTSELQSLMRISYAVFCLKKKKTKQRHKTNSSSEMNRNTTHYMKQ